jgi:hypothetical protein
MRFHATLAKDEGVSAIFFSASQESMPGNPNAPSFAQDEWDEIWTITKESGVPVGFAFHILPPGDAPQQLWPQEGLSFVDEMDFLAVSMWNHVSDKEFPSQSEIDAGYDKVFREIDYNYNLTKKPVVFGQVAYFSMNGSAMQKGQYEIYPSWEDPKIWKDRYDGKTQAMIYESLMKHVANRSHIQGVFPFGYYYATAPLNLDSDIRGKPAETVFKNWIARFP